MYEVEIHDALSKRDLETVWKLMIKRSVWLKEIQLSPEVALQALQATGEIEEGIRAQMTEIEKELIAARQSFQVAAAYERGRQV